MFSSHPFYTTYLQFHGEIISPEIHWNPKFWLYFCDALNVINKSHIPISPSNHLYTNYWNYKGLLSQNVLFICDCNMTFIYMLIRWERLVTNTHVYHDAIYIYLPSHPLQLQPLCWCQLFIISTFSCPIQKNPVLTCWMVCANDQ